MITGNFSTRQDTLELAEPKSISVTWGKYQSDLQKLEMFDFRKK